LLPFLFSAEPELVLSRTPAYMKILFALAGLEVLLERVQADFPDELTPVHMFAMAPKTTSTHENISTAIDDIVVSNSDDRRSRVTS
jgi:hypothetical protein